VKNTGLQLLLIAVSNFLADTIHILALNLLLVFSGLVYNISSARFPSFCSSPFLPFPSFHFPSLSYPILSYFPSVLSLFTKQHNICNAFQVFFIHNNASLLHRWKFVSPYHIFAPSTPDIFYMHPAFSGMPINGHGYFVKWCINCLTYNEHLRMCMCEIVFSFDSGV